MMPILDGYGVLRALENIPEMMSVPFIFMTAKTEKADFRKGMDMGADDYLPKPFTGDDLLRVVGTRLKKSRLNRKSAETSVDGSGNYDTAQALNDINILSDHKVVKKVKKKEMLFMEGNSSNMLYLVVSGKIVTYKTNEWGKKYTTEIYKENDFLGYGSLFDEGKHKESAVAIENSEIAIIPKQEFFQLLHSNKEVSMKFLKLLSNNLSESEEKLLKLAYDSARKRVAEALIFVSKKYDANNTNELSFPLYRENISSLAGISPESVSRNLTDFKLEKLIETDNGRIRIIDYKKLDTLKN
jgi:CRP-like cAMP-binding protein